MTSAASPDATESGGTPAAGSPTATLTPVIQIHAGAFGYADGAVVHGVELTIGSGEVVALVGPNGAGKTTLVKGLLGLTATLGGSVSLFGTPLAEFGERTRLGYVPQRHTLSSTVRATAREIVAVGRLPHRPFWRPANTEDARIVEESLRVVGLADRADTEVATLSGGQQRRVLIARALAGLPEAIVMDEPTAGVDVANQEALTQVLARLARRNVTLLIVTHELYALRDLVTRVVSIRDGGIVFDGTPTAYAKFDHGMAHDHGHHHPAEDALPTSVTGTFPAPLDPTWREADHV
ncbi:MAG: metal ABC transporter ATP-binding protein [Nostocoides sp.]